MEFYRCKHCGNIIAYAENKGVKVICCGEAMEMLEPNTVEASVEKHIPEVVINGNNVEVVVGSVLHPMTAEHNISWVAIETEQGNQRKKLAVDGEPRITFALVDGDRVKRVFAYCNLHGLWKKDF